MITCGEGMTTWLTKHVISVGTAASCMTTKKRENGQHIAVEGVSEHVLVE